MAFGGKCSECGKWHTPEEMFVLKKSVWNKCAKDKDFLHKQCVEKRIERKLTPNDFLKIPINDRYLGERKEINERKIQRGFFY